MNLDNGISALPTVQVQREMIATNGCKVSMCFRSESDVQIRHDVAQMLLAAAIKRRSVNHETGFVPVQGIHEGSSG